MGKIFVSCGQFTEAEKALGKEIVKMVKSITGQEAFFAEEVQDLNGLDSNILAALRDCSGFITVLHPRGKIVRPDGSIHIRASVWIEQEIAIATYIQRVENRTLPVIAFVHESVAREGIRDLLHLNPTQFRTEAEILSALPDRLNGWKNLSTSGGLIAIYNFDGTDAPVNISGRMHSVHGPMMDLYGLVTIVNLNQSPTKIRPISLTVDGRDFSLDKFFFREKDKPERFKKISVMGNEKGHYELHFMFPDDTYSEAKQGEFLLGSDGTTDTILIELKFS